MRPSGHSQLAAGLSIALMLLSGCSNSGEKEAQSVAQNSPSLGKNSFTGGVYSFPLDAYKETAEDRNILNQAEQMLIVECMQGFGFDSKYPKINQERIEAQDAEGRSRLYGITDLAAAQKYGYHLNPEIVQARPQLPPDSAAAGFVREGHKPGQDQSKIPDVATVSPGQYQGKAVPPGGYVGFARKKILGIATIRNPFTLAEDLQIPADFAAQRDSRVQGYFAQWSKCMAKSGYNLPDPLADHGFDVEQPKISAAEIETAVADVKCSRSLQLPEKWHKVIVEYENKAIEKNQLALTEEKKKRAEMLARATEVVTKSQQDNANDG